MACEPPENRVHEKSGEGVRIDMGSMSELTRPPAKALPPVPPEAFVNWIFVMDWNAFIHMAARDARLEYSVNE